jgi:hypothetical protein
LNKKTGKKARIGPGFGLIRARINDVQAPFGGTSVGRNPWERKSWWWMMNRK